MTAPAANALLLRCRRCGQGFAEMRALLRHRCPGVAAAWVRFPCRCGYTREMLAELAAAVEPCAACGQPVNRADGDGDATP
jgi:DNA-directed RNA polymerase subunit RPC12/RpoP